MIAMPLLAVRLIDLAIFGSLGLLWIGGATFIVLLYRWILRWERSEGPTTEAGVPALVQPVPAPHRRVPPRVVLPNTVAAREGRAAEALASHS
jgi:hypothetical protein